ncbi:polycystic kidney disease 2-like 2 protein isoform X1 [Drosophila miranda]|uniref:polycystic kidney disease 2-like 2 protein isoform X1 n=1 Tax=Drosophila miranda TaxID=7229 RepID=UPI0007E70E49|nr:polycystic kidney disease 2-like 2 protein isoform X1 [Drosophila miranda]
MYSHRLDQRPDAPPRAARAVSHPNQPHTSRKTAFAVRPATIRVKDLPRVQLPKRGNGAKSAAKADQHKVPATTESQNTLKTKKSSFFGRKKDEIIASQKKATAMNGLGRDTPVPQHLKVKTSRILYTTDEEVRDALMEFGVFIIFLVLTSLVTLSVRHPHMFYFNDTMMKLFTTRNLTVVPSVTVSFEKMLTVPDWWDYLVYNFINTLHGDMTSSTSTSPRSKSVNEAKTDRSSFKSGEDILYGEDGDVERNNESSIRKRDTGPGLPYGELDEIDRDENLDGLDLDLDLSEQIGETTKSRSARSDTAEAVPWAETSLNLTTHLNGRLFLHENLMLGPPRLRQIRVSKNSCQMDGNFPQNFNTCYAAYSNAAEENTEWHKGTRYRTMRELGATPILTLLAFYRSGGYTVDLTYDKDENLQSINKLKSVNWLDRGSRLCLVEFNLFNENKDIFQSVKLIAEIPPTGGVIPQAHLRTVKEYSFFTDISLTMTVVYIFWYIMVFYYTICEINAFCKSGWKSYFTSLMNILDNIVLVFCYLALFYNIWHTFRMKSITSKAHAQQHYQSIDVLCLSNLIYVDMMAVLAFLVWIKIFKFISFNKTLIQFTTTLRRCSKDLIGFSIMFGIVFLAYAQLGLLLFGTEHPDFNNFLTSVLTMIRMILGDFQYNLIQQSNRVLGPIYFLTYIVLVFFILLNMFLAIIMQTYNSVKNEITQGRSQLASYVIKKLAGAFYWITHCGRERRFRLAQPASAFNEADQNSTATELKQPKLLRRSMTTEEARYFENIPPDVQNRELFRLTNRVSLIEEVLEQLVTNIDSILRRFERQQGVKKT